MIGYMENDYIKKRSSSTGNANRRKAALKLKRRQQRRRRAAQRMRAFMVLLALCGGIIIISKIAPYPGSVTPAHELQMDMGAGIDISAYVDAKSDKYFEDLEMLLELNEEAADYITGYADREKYIDQPIDLTEDFQSGEVPLLMQWDRRWGYNAYGDNMIGLAGCGPMCLTMAYLYFTEDVNMTPREMASFAYENGYYTEAGTSWSLWTEGVTKLGLSGSTLTLDENAMKNALDGGGLIICSMRPGDFTATGHFILIRGYDKNGFCVNDPNRRSNSEKQWDYETLRYQIKNLWVLQY